MFLGFLLTYGGSKVCVFYPQSNTLETKCAMQKKMPSSIFQQRFEPIDPILTLAGSSKLQPLDPTTQDVPQIDVHPEPPKSPEHPKSMVKELTQSKRELVVTNFGLGSNKLKEIQIPFEGKKTDVLFEK